MCSHPTPLPKKHSTPTNILAEPDNIPPGLSRAGFTATEEAEVLHC